MKLPLRSVALLLSVAIFEIASRSVFAETYPDRPIRLVVPYPPGGSTDILARLIGEKISKSVGQPVVVENRAGAGGAIGSGLVAKAAPDGYTLVMATNGTHAINVSLYKSIPYDPQKDFAPVSMVASVPLLLVVPPSLPATSVKELVAIAKSKPGALNFGSASIGSSGHLAGEMLKTTTGIDIVHVPYKGDSQAIADMLGGQLSLLFANMPAAVSYVKAKQLRALAVSTAKRSPAMPQVATMQEAGMPGFEVNPWYGVLAPAETPKEIISKLHAEIAEALRQPDVQARMATLGAQPAGNTPEEFAAVIQAEISKYAKVIKDAGAQAE